jgi:L-ascorbate metabolism protein UlaG (beta-lactamase superfamily)
MTHLMSELTITRVAHAAVLLGFHGHYILTDPWFSQKPGYSPGEPLGVALDELPQLEGVVVSHGHYDHYDMEAFAAYPDKQVPMAVKRGIAERARNVGFTNVIELDAWETTTLGAVKVTAAPGKHKVPEITYVLEAEEFTVYFGADTLLIPELGEVAQRFPHIDLALFAVNGLRLRPLFNRQVVMNAQEAAQLCGMLRPRFAVPMHYAFTGGAFRDRFLLKYDGTPQEFQQAAAQHAAETVVRILPPGEPLTIPSWQPVH